MPRKPIEHGRVSPFCRGVAYGLLLSVPSFGLLAAFIYWWPP